MATTIAGIDKSLAKFGNIATDFATGLSPTKLAEITTSVNGGGWVGGNAGGPIAEATMDAVKGGFNKTKTSVGDTSTGTGAPNTNLDKGGFFKVGKF